MPCAAPTNKVDFYRRYMNGAFGNRPRAWPDWDELRESGYAGRVTVRDMTPGGPCYYGVKVTDLLDGVLPQGCDSLKGKRFNEGMPDEYLTIQGNVWLSETGLSLEYSREPNIGHRQAVRPPHLRTATGLMATSLLKTFMDPNSYDDLMELFELYPEAVVEFSTYSKKVGTSPQRNTVYWEVRNY